MIKELLWGITFLTLWVTIIWLNFLTVKQPKRRLKTLPTVSIGIPAFNESRTILKTITSLLEANYPKSKMDIIVVDNASTDETVRVVRRFIKEHKGVPVRVLSEKRQGKAFAVNAAFKASKGQYFAVVDADSRVTKESIRHVLEKFTDDSVGAVISRVSVDAPKNFVQRLQHFEYIMSNMMRQVLCNFGTLAITPGVLSMYRRDVLNKIGGFTSDDKNLTEDLEIAMRLKEHGYTINMAHKSVTFTNAPDTWAKLWRQRTRWSRGYVYNHVKYRSMFFSSKHGLFGWFQMPLNVAGVVVLLAAVGIVVYDASHNVFDFVYRSLTIPDYFINQITSFPTLKEFILAKDIQVVLPIIIAFALGVYLVYFAHKFLGEKMQKHLGSWVSFMVLMPYFSTLNWVSAIAQEVRNSKRKW